MFPRAFLRNINRVFVLFISLLATAPGNKSLPDQLSSQARSHISQQVAFRGHSAARVSIGAQSFEAREFATQ